MSGLFFQQLCWRVRKHWRAFALLFLTVCLSATAYFVQVSIAGSVQTVADAQLRAQHPHDFTLTYTLGWMH